MTNETVASPAQEDAQAGFADVEWEDALLVKLLRIRAEAREALAAIFDEYEGVSNSNLRDQIGERIAANGIGELDVGQRVRCGEFVFSVREFRREEETVIPPYEKMGITGIKAD